MSFANRTSKVRLKRIPVFDLSDLPEDQLSPAERISLLPHDVRAELLKGAGEAEMQALDSDWRMWRRGDQVFPDDFGVLAYIAGRRTGKTRGCAEYVNEQAMAQRILIALIAPTPGDARDIMIEGPAGLTNVGDPANRPTFEPTKKRLTWPNGSRATVYSAAEPDDLRGAGVDLAWGDEPVKWRFLEAAWANLRFAMSGSSWSGKPPRTLISSTPAPLRFFRDLRDGKYPRTVYRKVSTFRNIANLPPDYVAELLSVYYGTRLGRQELDAEILDDFEGALWTWERIEASRTDVYPDLQRIVVGVDPSGTKTGDECGIIVAGISADGHIYVIADYSGQYSPDEWGQKVVEAYHAFDADKVVAEGNFGADMVETILRFIDRNIPFDKVTSSRGKTIRAEPVASLWERRDSGTGELAPVAHLVGRYPEMETEMTEWVEGISDWSPGRMDALVFACKELGWEGAWVGEGGLYVPDRTLRPIDPSALPASSIRRALNPKSPSSILQRGRRLI